MDLTLIVGPAGAQGQLPDAGERDRRLTEHRVAAVGRILEEGGVAAETGRGDGQGGLHNEALCAGDVLAEQIDSRDPVDGGLRR